MRRFYLLCDCFHSDFAHSGKFLMHFNRYIMWCEFFLKAFFIEWFLKLKSVLDYNIGEPTDEIIFKISTNQFNCGNT